MKCTEKDFVQEPLISVIVPVYQVEAYFDRCIRSILNQTYTNLEIILVDDGSPDHCPQLCDEWAKRDFRIKVIHQKNGGLSNARNTGLRCCTGEYIGFVDSDDWVEPHMYETLYHACEKNNVCLSVCGRYDEYESGTKAQIGRCPKKQDVILDENMLPKMFLGDEYDSAVWDKLYHKSLWNERYFPEGEIYEDVAVMHRIVIAAQRIAMCNAPLYHYYHRANSITASGFREELFDYPKHTREVLEEIGKIYPNIKEYAIWAHVQALRHILKKLAKSEAKIYRKYQESYQQYRSELMQYRPIWNKSALFSRKERMKCEIMSRRWLARLIFK